MYKASVVIPNYNGEKYIDECMNALRKQREQSFEVILVDNASEDNSIAAFEVYNDLNIRTITLDEILDDSVELASKINTVLKCLNNQSDISFSAQMELKRLNACLTQSMDTAITGITSVMAWCEDNMGIELQDETEEIIMSF